MKDQTVKRSKLGTTRKMKSKDSLKVLKIKKGRSNEKVKDFCVITTVIKGETLESQDLKIEGRPSKREHRWRRRRFSESIRRIVTGPGSGHCNLFSELKSLGVQRINIFNMYIYFCIDSITLSRVGSLSHLRKVLFIKY